MLDWLIKYRWGLALGVAAGVGALAGWIANGWRSEADIAAIKTQHAAALAVATEQARATEQTWTAAYILAGENYGIAMQKNDRTLAAARVVRDGLRDQLAAARRAVSENPAAACPPLVDRAFDVLAECSERRSALAADAAQCAAEQQFLHDSWPR